MNSFNLKDRPSLYVHCTWESNTPDKTIEDAVSISVFKDEEIDENIK